MTREELKKIEVEYGQKIRELLVSAEIRAYNQGWREGFKISEREYKHWNKPDVSNAARSKYEYESLDGFRNRK